MVISILCFALIIIIIAILASLIRRAIIPHNPIHSSLALAQGILHPRTSLSDQLLARSIPNRKLQLSFGLENTFVSADIDVHRSFIGRAKSLIWGTSHDKRWMEWQQTATIAVGQQMPRQAMGFDVFIQRVTLSIILTGLLQADPEALYEDGGADDLGIVTQAISELWQLSKQSRPTPPHLLHDINRILKDWLPNEENPLDWVIPTYESLWRVVAVAVVYANRNAKYTERFITFHHAPTLSQFRTMENQWSIKSFIHEVLRLHPPTKHIRRGAEGKPDTVANVEVAHTDPAIWGADVGQFDPRRCGGVELLAFGHGQLSCVAKQWAPMAAAVIVSEISIRMRETHTSLKEGKVIGGRSGWDDWSLVPANY